MPNNSKRSNAPVLPIMSAFRRSLSPSGRFATATTSDSSSFSSPFSYSITSSSSSGSLVRSTSPTRVNLHGLASQSPSPSMRMSIGRSLSPRRSITMSSSRDQHQAVRKQSKKTCSCSPTTHPGSFRCAFHKNLSSAPAQPQPHSNAYSLKNLTIQRSAMKNSLVRIGTVEGDLVKRALSALIRPSSHQIRRRTDFQPRPSRLSIMSKADDDDL